MFNQVTLVGNVGADPECGTTQSGKKYVRFRLATSEKWKDANTGEPKEKTQWHSVVVWNESLANIVEQYVKKGSKLMVIGAVEYREWHKDGTPDDDRRWQTDIVLNGFQATIKLLDSRPSNRPPDPDDPKRDYARPAANGSGPRSGGAQMPLDDEIPFAPEVR